MSHFKFRAGAKALIAGLMVVALAACATPPAATSAPATAVTGKLSFVAPTPLPADAVAEVNLVDITVEAGEPQVVGSQQITIGSQASPIPFTVKYDASKINKEHTYGIAAKIVKGNEVYFVTTAPKPVLTQGNASSDVDVPLAPGGPEAPSGG